MSITEYVRDDLAARLRTGRELPAQLTLDSLADFYQVSFTPVRAAVAGLIEEGLLEKGPNRRLVVRVEPDDGNAMKSESVPLPPPPRDLYSWIVDDLVQMSLLGSEVYLREEVTAEKYNMSRSAIRNIFHRLAGEGILDHIPRRGWRLRTFRLDDLREFVEAREALELKALELAWPRLETTDLKKMFEANSLPAKRNEGLVVDESLHEYLINKSQNKYIRDFFDRQGKYYRLLFRWEDHEDSVAIETMRQHQEILSALIDRDQERGRIALSYHIRNNHPLLNQPPKPASDEQS